MTREEAVARATSIVEEMTKPPVNERGYRNDGWKPPTVGERTDAILRIAAFLIDPPSRLVAPDRTQEE